MHVTTRRRIFTTAFLTISLFQVGIVTAALNDWAEGTPGQFNGASAEFYNRAGRLAWKHPLGDWRDAKENAQGTEPFAVANAAADRVGKFVEWDVTSLVQAWSRRKWQNQGFYLRAIEGGGTRVFASREQTDEALRPQLEIVCAKGTLSLAPQADTYLESSTYKSQGNGDTLKISDGANRWQPALLRFDLPAADKLGDVTKATLRLHLLGSFGGKSLSIGVYRCSQGHDVPDELPTLGLAAKYPRDVGIAQDPAVVFATGFESETWQQEWTQAAPAARLQTLDTDPELKFEPFHGKALRSHLAKGELTALNTIYKFKDKTGAEPEEIYFRYYLRFGDDWNQTVEGGKMPGISGTYGVAGWGGRKANGNNGWSARGSFFLSPPADNPLAGLHPIGTYCYHADMPGFYGDGWLWQRGYRGFLAKNRWYCVEQYLKLNTPGEKDGVPQAWIDGRLALEKTDLRFRHTDRLKIEQVWMNVYHGGTTPSPIDQHLYVDNVVIAKQYIGPVR